jgi:CRP-like cAMP-binding protein
MRKALIKSRASGVKIASQTMGGTLLDCHNSATDLHPIIVATGGNGLLVKGRIPNHLLAAFPSKVYKKLASQFEVVRFGLGDVLFNVNDAFDYLYFPHANTMLSLLCNTEEGSVEVGVTGSEGFVGTAGILGGDLSPHEVIAQIPGEATRIKVGALKSEFQKNALIQRVVLNYVSALIAQLSQTALCNRVHTVEQRLARWLLVSQDRIEAKELPLTHEFLAKMLAVNRSTLSLTAATLKNAGLIHYTRARITVLKREGLEQVSCGCYKIVREHFRNILGNARPKRK